MGGQVHIANKNSNVDYDYGAYDSFEAIPETLYDTVQVGKTIGVVDETGKIKEYWWQMQEDGTYGWCEKGISREEVEAILDNYTAKDDIKKEVINVLTAADTAPDDMEDGDLYIAKTASKLYKWSEESDDWIEQTPDIEVIYKTLDENEMYVWNGTEFSEVGGDDPVVIDDTIYVGKDYDIPAAAADLPAGTYTAIVLEHVLESVILTSIGDLTEQEFIQFLKYDISGNTLSLKDCETLVANIETIPIDLNELGFKVTDEQMDYIEEHEIGYISGSFDREAERFTLLKISNDEMLLQTRKGWASMRFPIDEPVSPWTIKDVWEWHFYDYQGHKHTINEIEGAEDLIDHTIEDKPALGKLLITLNANDPDTSNHRKFLIEREVLQAPNDCTMKIDGTAVTPSDTAINKTTTTGSITLHCDTSGATIYYTTDGSDPTESNTRSTYSQALTFNQDETGESKTSTKTMKFVSEKNGEYSNVKTQQFVITRKIGAVTISASGNANSASRTITLSCATANNSLKIYYRSKASSVASWDGIAFAEYDANSKPTANVRTDFQAYATIDNTWEDSAQASLTIEHTVKAPTITKTGNKYSTGGTGDKRTITLACETSGATIYYQLGGTSGEWTAYTEPFELSSTTHVYVKATKSGWNNGTADENIVLGTAFTHAGVSGRTTADATTLGAMTIETRAASPAATYTFANNTGAAAYIWLFVPKEQTISHMYNDADFDQKSTFNESSSNVTIDGKEYKWYRSKEAMPSGESTRLRIV